MLDVIARSVGYTSEYAFTRAFTRRPPHPARPLPHPEPGDPAGPAQRAGVTRTPLAGLKGARTPQPLYLRSFCENSDTRHGGGRTGGGHHRRGSGDRGHPGLRKRVEPGRRGGHGPRGRRPRRVRADRQHRGQPHRGLPAGSRRHAEPGLGSYATGGRGGILDGSVVDHTASQGSLGLDSQHGLLYSVNAGSNTISVFAVHGDRLALRQVLPSGGTFPVSVTVHGDLVYVLNALNGGSVQGYRVLGTALVPLLGSHRPLGLDRPPPRSSPLPPGRSLHPGRLPARRHHQGRRQRHRRVRRRRQRPPVHHAGRQREPGTVPFAISFDQFGYLVIAEAGPTPCPPSRTSNGTVDLLNQVATRQAATCWRPSRSG